MQTILIILTLLLLSLPCQAQEMVSRLNVGTLGGGVGGANDSCSGGLLFSWHCENTTVTTGTPVGCSSGDYSATGSSTAAINSDNGNVSTDTGGTNSCDFPSSSDYYSFDVSSNDIVTPAAGTVIFHVKINTFINGAGIWRARVDAPNQIYVIFSGTDDATGREIRLYYAGTDPSTVARNVVTNSDLGTGTWYKIITKWSVVGVDEGGTKYLSIKVCNEDGTSCGSPVYGTSAPTNFVGSLGAGSLVIGEVQGTAGSDYGLDRFKIYNSWTAD